MSLPISNNRILSESKSSPNFILKLLEYERENKGEKRGAIEFRKFPAYIFKGIPNIKEVKMQILKSESISEIIDLINKNL